MDKLEMIEREISHHEDQHRRMIRENHRGLEVKAIENKLDRLYMQRDGIRMQWRPTNSSEYLRENKFLPDGYIDLRNWYDDQEKLKREYETQEKAKEKTLTRRQRRRSLASAINVEH